MRSQIKDFIKACDVCQRHKAKNFTPAGLLQPLPILDQICDDISMDFTNILLTSRGNSSILVVVGRFSKYSHFISMTHPYTVVGIT